MNVGSAACPLGRLVQAVTMYGKNVAHAHYKGFAELSAAAGPELLKMFRAFVTR